MERFFIYLCIDKLINPLILDLMTTINFNVDQYLKVKSTIIIAEQLINIETGSSFIYFVN